MTQDSGGCCDNPETRKGWCRKHLIEHLERQAAGNDDLHERQITALLAASEFLIEENEEVEWLRNKLRGVVYRPPIPLQISAQREMACHFCGGTGQHKSSCDWQSYLEGERPWKKGV
jgi:hypothetical protein